MKTGKPPWKKRILPAAALALAAPVLFFAFSLAAHLVSVADFGYPGGEMDFMGLGKNEVLKTLWEKCPRVFSEREMRLSATGKNCAENRYYASLSEAENDPEIRSAKYLGVNYRTRMASTYFQILEFDARGIVVAQRTCRYSDAP